MTSMQGLSWCRDEASTRPSRIVPVQGLWRLVRVLGRQEGELWPMRTLRRSAVGEGNAAPQVTTDAIHLSQLRTAFEVARDSVQRVADDLHAWDISGGGDAAVIETVLPPLDAIIEAMNRVLKEAK